MFGFGFIELIVVMVLGLGCVAIPAALFAVLYFATRTASQQTGERLAKTMEEQNNAGGDKWDNFRDETS